MTVFGSKVDRSAADFRANDAAMRVQLEELDRHRQTAIAGGGPQYVSRHRERGRLLARERIELLVDQDSPLLELSPYAAWGTEYTIGASVVSGVGVVEGVECVLIAHDPTVRGGAINPYGLRKILRAMDIARENRLPLINLVESGGADLPRQSEIFVPAGAMFRNLTQLSALGIPTIALVFGTATAGGAYVPALCDYVVMVKEQAHVFLAGSPLVLMATGEVSDDEELGGAAMHAQVSGVSDHLAEDDRDCVRLGRDIVRALQWRKLGQAPRADPQPPVHDPEELLGIAASDVRTPIPMREIIGRIVDGSRVDEFKPLYGTNLITGFAAVHGYAVGIVANDVGVIRSQEAQKASHFIQLCNRSEVPIVFLQNTTGYMVGKAFEQGGILKDGAKMINTVANSTVPHITVIVGASYGAGNYGMSGRSYNPRFLFAWPNSRTAVMGPRQLAGVMSIVSRQSAARSGRAYDEVRDAAMRLEVEAQIERESQALFNSAQLYDDGIIDPRDTRTVLGMALSACHSNVINGSTRFGVFRM